MATERRKAGQRAQGRQPKHGGRALARFWAANKLDRRTGLARDLYAFMDGLAEERGGWSNVTTGERTLMEVCAIELLVVRGIAAWMARQPSLVTVGEDGNQRLLGPLARGLTSHVGALTRALVALGIRPDKVDRLPSLTEYIAERQQIGPCGTPTAPLSAQPTTVEAEPTDPPRDASWGAADDPSAAPMQLPAPASVQLDETQASESKPEQKPETEEKENTHGGVASR